MDKYKEEKSKYRKACKAAKRTHEEHIRESIPNEEGMAKYIKNMTTSQRPKLGTIQKQNGDTTITDEETCTEMLNTHYPSNEAVTQHKYNFNKQKTSRISDKYKD